MDTIFEMARRLLAELMDMQSLLPTYAHLLASAIFPIYIASHASLSRPKSAPKPPKRKKVTGVQSSDHEQEDEDGDDDEKVKQIEGFSPSDAIILPITAGLTLSGLYFLIKWLEDPAILNKILGWYFGLAGAFAVSSLLSDSLRNIHTFAFPSLYRKGGVWFRVNDQTREARSIQEGDSSTTILITNSPLPGQASHLPLPASIRNYFWTLRAIANNKFELELRAIYFGFAKIQFDLFDIIGVTTGVTASLYANLVECPWWLTNLLGTALSYGALQMLSPTTFITGSSILSALFVYDIVMVFYTPMMVTVAKSLDVPIKLMFPQPAPVGKPDAPSKPSYAMLGLGDVVLPGIMIGLALRFDLYLYYLYKQKTTRTAKDNVETDDTSIRYVAPGKHWGTRFWTSDWLLRTSLPTSDSMDLGQFPKPYFRAAMTGYVSGMIVTLIAMQISHHPQPALLYLVPGVLCALWTTALFRGELKEMWQFTEATDEDEGEKDGSKKEGSKGEKSSGEKAEESAERISTSQTALEQGQSDQSSSTKEVDAREPKRRNSDVLLSLTVTKLRRRNRV